MLSWKLKYWLAAFKMVTSHDTSIIKLVENTVHCGKTNLFAEESINFLYSSSALICWHSGCCKTSKILSRGRVTLRPASFSAWLLSDIYFPVDVLQWYIRSTWNGNRIGCVVKPTSTVAVVGITHLPSTCISIRLGITEVNVALHYRWVTANNKPRTSRG